MPPSPKNTLMHKPDVCRSRDSDESFSAPIVFQGRGGRKEKTAETAGEAATQSVT
jgi:hypothetical protein